MKNKSNAKNLTYIPEVITSECFGCKAIFELYLVQKIGINFCKECNGNESFYALITLPAILKKIAYYAEQQDEKIEGNLVVDVSKLFEELQK